jgi:hypothetical protein
VVLPVLAESRLNPPLVTDMRQDIAAFDRLFRLPAARMRVLTTLAGARSPGWLSARRCWTSRWCTRSPPLPPSSSCCCRRRPPGNTKNAVAAAVGSLRLGSTEDDVMSISAAGQIGGEHCVSRAQASSVNAALQAAASRHVTVVAGSGDISLTASHTTGAWISETAWGLPYGDPGCRGGRWRH